MSKINWKYTPEQVLKIKARDVEAMAQFYQENLPKMTILIVKRMEKLKNFTNEIFDVDDYLNEMYLRLPLLNYHSNQLLTLSFCDNLVYIRAYRKDMYIEKNTYFFTNEDGDEVPYVDLIGKFQSPYESLDFLQKDMYGIKANEIFEFVSKFLRTQRQKDVLLLFLEGYTYTNIMLKLNLKSNTLGDVYKQISFNLLKHYSEIKKYLITESNLFLKSYDVIYNLVKSDLEILRQKKRERNSQWVEANQEKYKEIKRQSNANYRAKKKAEKLKSAI